MRLASQAEVKLTMRLPAVPRWVAGATIATLLLMACGGSTEPGGDEVAGTYQLVSVNGSPLPYEYVRKVVEGMTIVYSVHDARLEFRTRSRVYDIRTLDFLDPRPDTLVSGYRLEGTMLLLSQPNTPAYPAYTDTGTFENSVIIIRRRHLAGAPDINALFVYSRSSP
jgi:hypothetical protein